MVANPTHLQAQPSARPRESVDPGTSAGEREQDTKHTNISIRIFFTHLTRSRTPTVTTDTPSPIRTHIYEPNTRGSAVCDCAKFCISVFFFFFLSLGGLGRLHTHPDLFGNLRGQLTTAAPALFLGPTYTHTHKIS